MAPRFGQSDEADDPIGGGPQGESKGLPPLPDLNQELRRLEALEKESGAPDLFKELPSLGSWKDFRPSDATTLSSDPPRQEKQLPPLPDLEEELRLLDEAEARREKVLPPLPDLGAELQRLEALEARPELPPLPDLSEELARLEEQEQRKLPPLPDLDAELALLEAAEQKRLPPLPDLSEELARLEEQEQRKLPPLPDLDAELAQLEAAEQKKLPPLPDLDAELAQMEAAEQRKLPPLPDLDAELAQLEAAEQKKLPPLPDLDAELAQLEVAEQKKLPPLPDLDAELAQMDSTSIGQEPPSLFEEPGESADMFSQPEPATAEQADPEPSIFDGYQPAPGRGRSPAPAQPVEPPQQASPEPPVHPPQIGKPAAAAPGLPVIGSFSGRGQQARPVTPPSAQPPPEPEPKPRLKPDVFETQPMARPRQSEPGSAFETQPIAPASAFETQPIKKPDPIKEPEPTPSSAFETQPISPQKKPEPPSSVFETQPMEPVEKKEEASHETVSFKTASMPADRKKRSRPTVAADEDLPLRKMAPVKNLTEPVKEESWFANHLKALSADKGPRASREDLAVVTRQLSAMLGAGIPLHSALEFCVNEENKAAEALEQVAAKVASGVSVSHAMRSFPGVFDPVFVGLVQTGEMSGQLTEIFDKLASLLERQVSMQKKMVAALTYPMVLLVVAVVGVTGFIYYVLPMITPMFEKLGTELPLPTRILIELRRVIPVGVGAVVLGAFLSWFCRPWWNSLMERNVNLRRTIDALPLQLPLVGPVMEKIITSRVLYSMSTMLDVGIGAAQAYARSEAAAGNSLIAYRLEMARKELSEGATVAESLGMHKVFPEGALVLISVGEEAADLSGIFRYVANFYEEEVEYALNQLASMLEPLIMVGMGLVVGFISLSAALPTIKLLGEFS